MSTLKNDLNGESEYEKMRKWEIEKIFNIFNLFKKI